MLKKELVSKLKAKVSKAHPAVRANFTRGLGDKTKPQLQSLLRRAKVTRNGDISLS